MATTSTPPPPTPPPQPPGPYVSQLATFYVEASAPDPRMLLGATSAVPWEILANLKLLLPADVTRDIVICGWDGVATILRELEALASVMARRR